MIPLLLNANPKVFKETGWIPVDYDFWSLEVEGLDDSILSLHFQGSNKVTRLDSSVLNHVFKNKIFAKIRMVHPGNERQITIMVKQCQPQPQI